MSEDVYNLKDMSFEAKFTIDKEGLRGLAAFLKEQDDEILDAIFNGKQGLILCDPKRGTAELSHVVRCKDCKWYMPVSDIYGKCTYRTREHLYNEPTDYCSYGERKDNEDK